MSSFIFSINATFPLFIIIAFGYFLKKVKMFDGNFLKVVDKFVFKVALPFMLFDDISQMDLYQDFDVKFVIYCMITTTLMFAIPWVLSMIFMKDKTKIGAFAQGCSRGSAAVLGVALVENIYGEAGQAPLMILSAVPLFNVYSVIILTFGSSEHQEKGLKFVKKLIKGVVTNPIILGIACGFPFALLKLQLPVILDKAVESIAATSTPLALLSIGAAFEFKDATAKLKPALLATAVKLMILPMVFIPIAIKLGFVNDQLAAILIMLASSATPSGYIMSKNMHNDHILSSNIIVLTTLFSCVTLTFWVWLLKSMGCL
jgi:hypothetical protein